jgi:hypothetical protein
LADLLYDIFQSQKRYGEKKETIDSIVKFFRLMLAEYNIEDITASFMRYARIKDDIPAPANIIQLIENPPPVSYDDFCCSCGKHYGMGCWTPDKRAWAYAWFREKGYNYTSDKQQWLESYEIAHGKLEKS